MIAADSKQLILVIAPVVAVAVLLIITSIAIIRKLRRNSYRNTLPITEKPPLHRHLDSARSWPQSSASSSTLRSSASDPNPLPFLAQFSATHPPQSSYNMTWQQVMDKQQQREPQSRQSALPLEQWNHKPKGAVYWGEVGAETEARKTWSERVQGKLRLV